MNKKKKGILAVTVFFLAAVLAAAVFFLRPDREDGYEEQNLRAAAEIGAGPEDGEDRAAGTGSGSEEAGGEDRTGGTGNGSEKAGGEDRAGGMWGGSEKAGGEERTAGTGSGSEEADGGDRAAGTGSGSEEAGGEDRAAGTGSGSEKAGGEDRAAGTGSGSEKAGGEDRAAGTGSGSEKAGGEDRAAGTGSGSEKADGGDRTGGTGSGSEEAGGDAQSAQKPGQGAGKSNQIAAEPGQEATRAGGVSDYGALQVIGSSLCDSRGNPVQLRGVSTHGLAWFPEYVNEALFQELREQWKVNVVRLAMYTGEYGGYCTGGDRDQLKQLIRDGVTYASNQDMYVIIDWHILSDEDPNTYREEAESFFGEMSAEFADLDNVLYEICNEPNGGTGWSRIKEYAEEIIPVIRDNDEDAVILVGTPNWSQYVDQAAADPVTDWDNIMYTLHFYAATHRESLRQTMTAALDGGLPIFVSEYSICDASGNGGIDEAQAEAWVETMDRYGVSYVAWNLSNKNETSSLFSASCNKTSGFTREELSSTGKWLYGVLTGGQGEGLNGREQKDQENGEQKDQGNGGQKDQENGEQKDQENGEQKDRGNGEQKDQENGEQKDQGNGEQKDQGDSGQKGQGNGGQKGQEDDSQKNQDRGKTGWLDSGVGQMFQGNQNQGSKDGESIDQSGSGQSASEQPDGVTATAGEGLAAGIVLVNRWESNGSFFYQFEVTVENTSGGTKDGWSVDVVFQGTPELSDSWNGVYTVEGNTLHISSVDYNGKLDSGATAENIGFIVSSGTDLLP